MRVLPIPKRDRSGSCRSTPLAEGLERVGSWFDSFQKERR